MKRILYIEDRISRKEHFLNFEDIEKLEKIVEQKIVLPLIESINEGETDMLNEYDLLIFHRSALSQEGLNNLKEFCKKNKSDLILFSGGISQLVYSKDNFQLLIINSKDFYNNNLINFLHEYKKGDDINLLYLLYKDQWKITFLLKYQNDLYLYHNENDSRLKFDIKERLNQLKSEFDINEEKIDELIKREIEKI